VPGAEVKVYRVQDPVQDEGPSRFEEGVLDAPPITEQVPSDAYAAVRAPILQTCQPQQEAVLSCTLCIHTGADVSSLYTAYKMPAPCITHVLSAV
jgi:hypothetical protein